MVKTVKIKNCNWKVKIILKTYKLKISELYFEYQLVNFYRVPAKFIRKKPILNIGIK